jgi:hypothetical protein
VPRSLVTLGRSLATGRGALFDRRASSVRNDVPLLDPLVHDWRPREAAGNHGGVDMGPEGRRLGLC